MYGADDHVVIRGYVVVVEMHVKQTIGAAAGEHNRFAHHFAGNERVPGINGNSNIRVICLLSQQKR